MRHLIWNTPYPCPPDLRPRLARLTRHLQARLLDFGPGGPQVLSADQEQGRVEACFPGQAPTAVLSALQEIGVFALLEGDHVVFLLPPDTRFEDLDYLWGSLYSILGP